MKKKIFVTRRLLAENEEKLKDLFEVTLNKDDKINLDFTKLGKNKLFYDVIYNPSETNFLNTGKKLGNTYENGKLMFIYQAFLAFKLWHEVEPIINNETLKLLNQ